MIEKGSKIDVEFNKWNQSNLVKKFKEDFIKIIPESKNKKSIIKYAENINWDIIINLCNTEIEKLVDTFKIPKNFHRDRWLITFFKIELLKLLRAHLYYKMLFQLNKIDDKYDNPQRKKIYKKIIKQAVKEVQDVVELFKIQTKFSNLKWINDSDTRQSEIEELKVMAEKGEKFSSGKKNRKFEIESFKNVEVKYKQSLETEFKISYRSIAMHIARNELGLIHENEQINYYNRFLAWQKKNNK